MHHGELSRPWRGYPHSSLDKRACRSSGGKATADSSNEVRRATSFGSVDMSNCVASLRTVAPTYRGLFRLRRRYLHSTSDKQACRSSSGVCEADSTSELVEPLLLGSVEMMQLCCIISTEGYRSGHNEAVLKTVWVHAHVGSNPTPSV